MGDRMTLKKVIDILEGGCDPKDIAIELRKTLLFEQAIKAGDSVLVNEQAWLLRRCRAALDVICNSKSLQGLEFQCGLERNSIGNLRADLFSYARPLAILNPVPDCHSPAGACGSPTICGHNQRCINDNSAKNTSTAQT